MRTILQFTALIVLLGVGGEWAMNGRKGWTHNSETHFVTDPVTGIAGPVEEKKFVPGVDFLGAGVLCAGVLGGASFLFSGKRKPAKTT